MFALCAILFNVVGIANALPPPHIEIVFEVKMGGMKLGQGVDRITHDSKSYSITSQTIPKGLASLFLDEVIRKSEGEIVAKGLTPSAFSEIGNKKKGDSSALFDWSNKVVTLKTTQFETVVPFKERAADQAILPYLNAFRENIINNEIIYVTDGRRIKRYQYERLQDDTLTTSLGKLKVAHFRKVVADDKERQFEFWLAHDHHLLPVKLMFVDKKGRTIESNVLKLEIKP